MNDLLTLRDIRPGSDDYYNEVDKLIALITKSVLPDSWDEAGGSGCLAEVYGTLAVSQSQEAHLKIESLLNTLRRQVHRRNPAVSPRQASFVAER